MQNLHSLNDMHGLHDMQKLHAMHKMHNMNKVHKVNQMQQPHYRHDLHDLHELHDDEEMLSQVRVFIKECSTEQIAEQIPRVLMDPVDRWLGDLMTLNIADGAAVALQIVANV